MNRMTPSTAPHPPPTLPGVEAASNPRAISDTRLSGYWLLLARAVWVTVAALIVTFFVANVPVYFAQMRTVCSRARCAPWQLTPASAQAIRQIHLSPTGYALVSLVFTLACVSVWFAIAAIIAWRQSRQWLGLVISLTLIEQCIIQLNASFATPLEMSAPAWHGATIFAGALSLVLYLLAFSLFPNGRFVPKWMRWAVVGVPLIFWAYATLIPSDVSDPLDVLHYPLAVGLVVGMFLLITGAQIYRYRRVSTPVERQQTKWIVLGVGEGPLVGIMYFLLPDFFPALSQPNSLYFLLGKPIYNLLWLFVPICFAIAILRYHLWDIDVIIRRTLVYGSLTALLAALYFAVVAGLQALVGSVDSTAASSPTIIVPTTLLIAALFTPLRRRIQATIDRRFYRRKYNAARTIGAFGATLRSEVDLAQLRAQLIRVVEETMRPAHVSLWLRPPKHEAGDPH